MALLNLKSILAVANQHKFAVGAFNAIDSNFIDAVFAAAQQQQSPVIINVAEVHLKYIDLEPTVEYIKKKAALAGVPVCLNLDHGLTFPTIERAIKCGFSSIMFDGSQLSYAENIAQTRKVVELCQNYGISVEGELGAVGGDEGGALESHADVALYTKVEQAVEFVHETGIDALAVAIGNTHGKYKGIPKLDFERLEQIHQAVSVPLVLHGGSGLSVEDFQKTIQRGICKINFFTGMSQAALQSVEQDINNTELDTKYNYYLMMMNNMQQAINRTVAEQMQIFNSINKAQLYAGS
ncbi:ketose 1,6-bisphosphate aldolase [Pasteurella dagmatis]|uniref:Ketose-bisphosphate aldolase n=1 Tax=Pasteurella dagmatis ATCC 43325 TaxID=667128 RepID=C9PSI4_9PAST|nr:ketose 1,6-bisphosphate aldolase [Pasteurella dagmatis]EEX49415.1 ketose-bisphosphate aldolase [Pasteurella dagmatis ATCC 43325]SNV82773.1 fructose-1,6-bisphosphate aldolase [Pasteurella dagmatis]